MKRWRPYGADPLPTGQEALGEPLAAFPSWFLRLECDRCGKGRMLNEADVTAAQRGLTIRIFLARARHEGCGGRAAKAVLMTAVEAASSRPVRRIVLLGLAVLVGLLAAGTVVADDHSPAPHVAGL